MKKVTSSGRVTSVISDDYEPLNDFDGIGEGFLEGDWLSGVSIKDAYLDNRMTGP